MYEFGYNSKPNYLDYLELEDIYNVALEAIDADGLLYYLYIRCSEGICTYIEYGPISMDDDILPDKSSIEFNRMKSKDAQIMSLIQKFLSPRKRLQSTKAKYDNKKTGGSNYAKIVEVNELDYNVALDRGINLLEYMKQYDKISKY